MSDDLFKREVLKVSELTSRLKTLIEGEFAHVWISGEISNLSRPASGHLYLTLKDQSSQIKAVMFKNQQKYLEFPLEDGQEVLAKGRISVYEPRGEYQIVIDYMELHGEGALRLAFEKLKARLAKEGLFDDEHKKPIPFLPQKVAVVTSPSGAAIRDFIQVARSNFPNTEIYIYPVRVQGKGSELEIARAVYDINTWNGADVIVLTRGGGSLEDLWAFNEEVVARAVFDSAIPVVSAVGHQIDFSISDFVADLRAPTPTAAAGLIFPEKEALQSFVAGLVQRMILTLEKNMKLARAELDHNLTRLGRPGRILENRRFFLDELLAGLETITRDIVITKQRRLREIDSGLRIANPRLKTALSIARLRELYGALQKNAGINISSQRRRLEMSLFRLHDLSPKQILKRGYSVVQKLPDREIIKSSSSVSAGQRVNVLLSEGSLEARVEEVKEDDQR